MYNSLEQAISAEADLRVSYKNYLLGLVDCFAKKYNVCSAPISKASIDQNFLALARHVTFNKHEYDVLMQTYEVRKGELR